MWVRTGSADEFTNEAGLSHFIEHLVFKGTKKYKPGEIAKAVEKAGGELNAYTSFDQTVFYVTVPVKKFEVACSVLSDMVTSPLFDELEVNNEREVVIEEIKMGLDQASRVSSKMLFEQMFSGYPYANPVIGTKENIKRLSLEEIKSYFSDRYHRDNMSLICVGDFEREEEITKTLSSYFSNVHINEKPKVRKRSHRDLTKIETNLFQESNFEKDYFYISWPVEGFKESSSVPYELLSLVLGQGESSYLYKDLKLQKGLCRSIGASYFSSPDDGVFVISGVCSPDEKEALFKEIPKTLESFFSQEDLTEEIKKAQNIFSSEQSYSEESIASQCRLIGDDWLYYDAFGATEERKKKALLLDASDMNECSKKLLNSKPHLALLGSKPLENSKDFLQKMFLLKEKTPNFKAEKLELLSVESLNKVKKQNYSTWITEKGSRVHLLENYETEVISFKMAGLGGELLLSDEEQGLTALFSSLWSRETRSMTEAQMTYLFDKYCSSLSAFSGKHSFGLSLKSLSYFFDKLKFVVSEVLEESVFNESLLKRDIQSKLYMIKAQKDRPSSLAFKAFNEMLFKDSFYSRDFLGTESYFNRVGVSDLEKHLKDQLSQKRTYSIVGSIEKSKVEDFINKIEEKANFSNHKNLLTNREFVFNPEGGVIELASDKAQAHIVLAYPGFDYKDERKTHLKLLEAVFGGQGGRLFIELRDKASLAYSVAPVSQSAYFGGFFGGYIACDPTKKEKAINMMRNEFIKFAKNKITDDELNWAKNQVLGQELMSLQKNSSIADQILFDSLYGLGALDYQILEDKVNTVTIEDLSNTMKSLLSKPEYLVTVG